jgi:hypothetical protein
VASRYRHANRVAGSPFQKFGETFNKLNRSSRERTRGGFVDLEREWRDFLRGWSGGVWESLSASILAVRAVRTGGFSTN